MRSIGSCGHTVRTCLAACLFVVSLPAAARPVIFEETARLTSPDPNFRLWDVAIDGDDLLAVSYARSSLVEGRPRRACEDVSDSVDIRPDILLLHYRRQGDGSWQLQGQIASGTPDEAAFWRLALRGGIGAFVTGRGNLSILERTSAGWKVTPFVTHSDVSEVIVRNGTIAIGAGSDSTVRLLGKNAAGAGRSLRPCRPLPHSLTMNFSAPISNSSATS
jgi:hypothetical protein